MASNPDVQQFLTALRGRITPEQAGLTTFGSERRVPGLRREEVAQLAGVSTAYYTRMERGDLGGVSESVLYALVRALELNEAESAHLFDLARAATGLRRAPRVKPTPRVSPRLALLIDALDVPALAMTQLGDCVASNPMGRALFPDLFPPDRPPLNGTRYLFLDDRARVFYPDWEKTAREAVSGLRLMAGHDPSDRALMALVGELATRSADFRTWWGGHTVRTHFAGTKTIHHPVVGDMTLGFEVMALPSTPGLNLLTYIAEPSTPSADALNLLRSWTADSAATEIDTARQH
ncbi:helix-turn-helix transcriptional regulator [Terrabacter aerolatus]|uniref:Transcriptional regulator n=1 Tax=Terrabacter aerolatus TaxID=422442 RepID=A0A512D718_9MICO|nr:helix-turn-helix transcriptional regulator [Terrabacter aerolatus]GEO32275.1 transcriptional regulator [Terrabacter aerolatus]